MTATFKITYLKWLSKGGNAATNVISSISVPHEFNAWEQGGFFPKTIPQLNTPEFQAMVIAGCAISGVDCTSVAAGISQGAAYATPYVSNSNLSTTAWIDRHPGEEYYAKFAAPSGYTTCKSQIDVGNGSITGSATFNDSLQRMAGPNADGIGLYAVVPKNRPSGQWVKFRVDVLFVPKGTEGQYRCWPDNTLAFQCTGQNCNTPQPGSRR